MVSRRGAGGPQNHQESTSIILTPFSVIVKYLFFLSVYLTNWWDGIKNIFRLRQWNTTHIYIIFLERGMIIWPRKISRYLLPMYMPLQSGKHCWIATPFFFFFSFFSLFSVGLTTNKNYTTSYQKSDILVEDATGLFIR